MDSKSQKADTQVQMIDAHSVIEQHFLILHYLVSALFKYSA